VKKKDDRPYVNIGGASIQAAGNSDDLIQFARKHRATMKSPELVMPKLVDADSVQIAQAAAAFGITSNQMAGVILQAIIFHMYSVNTLEAGLAAGVIKAAGESGEIEVVPINESPDLNVLKTTPAMTDISGETSIWAMYGAIYQMFHEIHEAVDKLPKAPETITIHSPGNGTVH